MSEEKSQQVLNDKIAAEEKRLAQARIDLTQKLKARGAQSLSYKEYMALKNKKGLALKTKIPAQLKFILATPVVLIVCFGAFFIPYMLFLVATGKPTTHVKKPAADLSLDDIVKKPAGSHPVKTK